jgi:hydrogenase-4 component B
MPATLPDWPLNALLFIVLGWLLVGVAGLFALRRMRLVAQWLFPLGGLIGLLLCGLAAFALFDRPHTAVLPLGLPQLPFHVRLDALSAFFLMVLGGAAAGISAFAAGYFRSGEGTPPGLLCLQYHLFLASMAACCWPTMPTPSW